MGLGHTLRLRVGTNLDYQLTGVMVPTQPKKAFARIVQGSSLVVSRAWDGGMSDWQRLFQLAWGEACVGCGFFLVMGTLLRAQGPVFKCRLGLLPGTCRVWAPWGGKGLPGTGGQGFFIKFFLC